MKISLEPLLSFHFNIFSSFYISKLSSMLQQMIVYIISILLALTVFVGYRYIYWPKKQIKRYKKILEGQGYKVHEQPFAFFGIGWLTDVFNSQKLGVDPLSTEKNIFSKVDFAIGNYFDKVMIEIVNPAFLKEFWSAEGIAKYKKEEFFILSSKQAFGQGMIYSQGQTWKNKRRIISKVFSFDLIKANIPKIAAICDRWLDEFDQTYKMQDGKTKFDPKSLSVRIFNGVIMKCFFGCDQTNEQIKGQRFEQFTVKMLQNMSKMLRDLIFVLFGKFAYKYGLSKTIRESREDTTIFLKIVEEIRKRRYQQVIKSQRTEKCTDLLQAILYQRSSGKQDFQFSDNEIIHQFSTFLIAGTDTTSLFFTMMLYYIAREPRIQEKLRKQVGEVIHRDSDITNDTLRELTYIDWIQHETTRHYGPANGQFFRIAVQDNNILTLPITKGTLVTSQSMGNHYSQKYFKDPTVFRPERWEKQCDTLPAYAFTGFGGGPRACIGKQLAHLETKIALVKLILRYKQFILPSDNITMKFEFLYEPSPFEIIFVK